MEKVCTKCKELKDLCCFGKKKTGKNGIRAICKKCKNTQGLIYKRALNEKGRSMYRNAVWRCMHVKSYSNRDVNFSLEWFEDWIKTSGYRKLHKAWVASGYLQRLAPSLDRIDNSKGYRKDNIQIITLSENISKDTRGVKCKSSKLTEKDVAEIRELYKTGECTQKELGSKFNVSGNNICCIVNVRTWLPN